MKALLSLVRHQARPRKQEVTIGLEVEVEVVEEAMLSQEHHFQGLMLAFRVIEDSKE